MSILLTPEELEQFLERPTGFASEKPEGVREFSLTKLKTQRFDADYSALEIVTTDSKEFARMMPYGTIHVVEYSALESMRKHYAKLFDDSAATHANALEAAQRERDSWERAYVNTQRGCSDIAEKLMTENARLTRELEQAKAALNERATSQDKQGAELIDKIVAANERIAELEGEMSEHACDRCKAERDAALAEVARKRPNECANCYALGDHERTTLNAKLTLALEGLERIAKERKALGTCPIIASETLASLGR